MFDVLKSKLKLIQNILLYSIVSPLNCNKPRWTYESNAVCNIHKYYLIVLKRHCAMMGFLQLLRQPNHKVCTFTPRSDVPGSSRWRVYVDVNPDLSSIHRPDTRPARCHCWRKWLGGQVQWRDWSGGGRHDVGGLGLGTSAGTVHLPLV